MANQRLTKKKLKNHLAYSWWKYALAAAVSTMLVSIVFAVTEYRPPDDKKVEFYVLNSYADTETMQADFWPLLQARKPEQEKLTVININLTDSSNIYAPMQFSTYVAAQQGDLFLISRDEMLKITSDGAQESLVELTPYLEKRLDELVEKYDFLSARRGKGFMQGIVIKGRPVGDVVKKALAKGLLVISAGSDVLRLVPPLVITKEDIDKMAEILDECME